MEQKTDDQRETEKSMEEKKPAAASRSRFKRICVFGGSSAGTKDCYRVAAVELGQELVARKIGISYGGGNFGLMGLVAQEVHRGGHVLGVIPKPMMHKEIIGETIGEVIVVNHMHQRKAGMAKDADCFIALPGGYGTLEMLMEVITWSQLGIHDKPVGLLNVEGYYDSLLAFFKKAVDEGFVYPSQLSIIVSASKAKELVEKLEDYVPQHQGVIDKSKWEADRTAETWSNKDDDQSED